MKRRESLKILGSLPFLAWGATSLHASEHTSSQPSNQRPKNIVLISADGMGVCQWQAGMIAAKGQLNLGRMQSAGLVTTHPANVFCGDAPSHSTALATGFNSNKGAVSVDFEGKPIQNITELVKEKGMAVGIVSANSLVEGSIVPFIGHASNRMALEQFTANMVDGNIDVFIGAGSDYFTKTVQMGGFGPGAGGAMPLVDRKDRRNLIDELQVKGWQVCNSIDEIAKVKSGKLAGFTGAQTVPNILQGRGDMFPVAVSTALNILQNDAQGFFLMIGDMFVDRASHNGKLDLLCSEAIDLDRAVGKALDFAEKDGNTLVLVIGSPEASGMSLVGGNIDEGTVEAKWSMPGMAQHSGTQVPMFAFGPGADQFAGICQNTAIFHKMKNLLSL